MEIADVSACSFPSWYSDFEDVTIRSVCIPLDDEFVNYLREDGLVLPHDVETSSASIRRHKNSSSSEEESWSDSESSEPEKKQSFPELGERVRHAISHLGGSVFVKLNWSSPKDASWIGLNRSLLCRNFGDVILLLKASEFVQHDLSDPFGLCRDVVEGQVVSYSLVLRAWTEVNPASEYRCFVKQGNLIGISQRDITTHYKHVLQERSEIKAAISRFFEDKIKQRFNRPNYTFDVYLTSTRRVKLLDFNPFGETTDALLFDWEELLSDEFNGEAVDYRYVPPDQTMRAQEYSRYQLPVDMVDLMSGTDPDKLVDFLKLQTPGNNQTSNSSEDEAV